MKKRLIKIWQALSIVILTTAMVGSVALAQHTSDSYLIDEYFFGSGGTLDATSDSYTIRASVGDIGVGNSIGTLFQLYAGYTTTTDPFLEFVVTPATISLGTVTVSAAATGEATFYVRTYLASGYAVTTFPDTPSNGNYHIDNLATPTASSPGTEQFGINLVENTGFGADPRQEPLTFGFGEAAANYDQPDLFTYNNGDVIAFSDSSSGTTVYTISYMMNVGEMTPGGIYTMDHVLIATSTF